MAARARKIIAPESLMSVFGLKHYRSSNLVRNFSMTGIYIDCSKDSVLKLGLVIWLYCGMLYVQMPPPLLLLLLFSLFQKFIAV